MSETTREKLTRVRLVHDSTPEDPREHQGTLCVISHVDRWTPASEIIASLIQRTKLWIALENLNFDIDPEYDPDDLPNLYEGAVLAQWLEMVKDELLVEVFDTGHRDSDRYVAHVSREGCEGNAPWEDMPAIMASEIETFTQWAEGEVYGVVIEEADPPESEDDEPEWAEVDSCWGFYGDDPFTNGMSGHVPEQLHGQLRQCEVEYEY